MIRLLAFALNAHERLEFGKGISDSDEPDLWRKDLAGSVYPVGLNVSEYEFA
jgi:uncharacterized protein YaeQ